MTTLPRLLVDRVQKAPQTVLANRDNQDGRAGPLTALSCLREVSLIAAGLRGLGMRRGDAIALLGLPGTDALAPMLAVLSLGGVVVACPPEIDAQDLKHRLEFGRCACVFISTGADIEGFITAARHLPGIHQVIFLSLDPGLTGHISASVSWESIERERLMRIGQEELEQSPLSIDSEIALGKPDDTALVTFIPDGDDDWRGIMLDHRGIIEALLNIGEIQRAGPKDFWFIRGTVSENPRWILPFIGLLEKGIWNDEKNGVILVASEDRWEEIANRIRDTLRRRPIIVKTITIACLSLSRFSFFRFFGERVFFRGLRQAADLSTLRGLSTGFSGSNKVYQLLKAAGISVGRLWGPSASAGFLVVDGRPLPGIELRLADTFGVDPAAGSSGRVLARGSQIMKGYFRQPLKTRDVLDRDGWLKTSDHALMLENGTFEFTPDK